MQPKNATMRAPRGPSSPTAARKRRAWLALTTQRGSTFEGTGAGPGDSIEWAGGQDSPGTSYPRTACGTRRSPSPSTPAPPCAMCRTTPGTRTLASPAGTITPGVAWTGTPPTRSRPTSPDRTLPGGPRRPRRYVYVLEPIRHGPRGRDRSWRGRQRFPPSRLSRSIRPIRPRNAQA